MIVNRAGNHKMIVKVANREYPDYNASSEQSDLDLRCLSILFWQATIVRNFIVFFLIKKQGLLSYQHFYHCFHAQSRDNKKTN